MAETLVWAFQPLPELKGETGFVACDADLAEKLLAAEKVQNPNVGAHHLKEIVAADVEYSTKVMAPKKRKSASEDE